MLACACRLVPKKRHLKWLERKLEEQTLCKSRQQAITELIASKLSQANSSNLPRASDLDSQAEVSCLTESILVHGCMVVAF